MSSSSDEIMKEMAVNKVKKEDEDDTMSNNSNESSNNSEGSKPSQIDLKQRSRSSSPTEVSLKRSKPKFHWIKRMVTNEVPSLKLSDTKDVQKTYLKISNFPIDWTFTQIKEFILKEYGPVDNIFMACDDDCCFTGMIKLEFDVFDKCWNAWNTLKGKVVEGVELHTDSIADSDGEDSDEELAAKKKKKDDERWRPDIDVRDTDPKGLYGMKPQFLASLGITPPLDKWVYVSNFRCDKSELKEVLELAGEVLLCSIDNRGPKFAWVMYSHPLEAVQAVSMLNDQSFYGQNLKVRMERKPVGAIILPKGLMAVGPGLGSGGKPLRDIVTQYERFVKHRSSHVNSSIFLNPDILSSFDYDKSIFHGPKSVPDLKKSSKGPQSAEESPHSIVSRLDTPSPGSSNGAKSLPSKLLNTRVNSDSTGSNSCPFPSKVIADTESQGPLSAPGTIPVLTSSAPRTAPVQGSGPVGLTRPILGPISMQGPRPIQGPSLMGAPSSIPRPMAGPNSIPVPTPMPVLNRTPGQSPIQGPSPMQSPGPISAPGLRMPGPSAPIYRPTFGPHAFDSNVPRGPMFRPQGPIARAPIPGPSWAGPGPMQGFNGHPSMPIQPQATRPMGPMQSNSNPPNGFATVELFNLPFNSTFAMLSEKMAQCGQVISLQLTTPGCAVVKFGQRAHAERCFQLFNHFTVGNNTIGVRFL